MEPVAVNAAVAAMIGFPIYLGAAVDSELFERLPQA